MVERIADMTRTEWATINIPRTLLDKVQRFIKENSELGYSSPSEYIREAIRLKIQADLQRMSKEKIKKTESEQE